MLTCGTTRQAQKAALAGQPYPVILVPGMMTLSWHSKKLDLSDFRVRLQSVLSFTIQPAQFYARLKGDEISPSDFAGKDAWHGCAGMMPPFQAEI